MILVVGGTGAMGRATVRRLLDAGEPVRVMTRTLENAAELQQLGAEVVQGDLCDYAALERAVAGVDKVLAAAHSVGGRGKEASKFVDGRGNEWLIDLAKAAGVQHFVYTSSHGVSADHPTPFFRFKYGVEQYLKASGLRYTILRPTAFFESHVHMLIGEPIMKTGKVTLFGAGENPRNFVAADDVAQFAVLALHDPQLAGRTIEIGGLANKTNMEVVQMYDELTDVPVKVSHVPLGMLRLLSPILRPFHAGLSQIMALSIWQNTTDQTFDVRPMLAEFPVQLTPIEEWVRADVEQCLVLPSFA